MTFLHPAFLAAGVAIGLPVLVHFLTRPRPVRMPLSTVRFILKAVQQRRARHRLRDALVLLLRIAAVALLVWAFARPLTGEKPLVAAAAEGNGARVVVLDQSASMGATVRGVSAFEKARPVAGEFLSPGGGTRANLVLAAAAPRAAFDAPTANAGALRDELRGAAVRPERLDAQAAINLAARMLAAAPPGHRRELVIVSDFQRGNWAAADFSPLPQDTKIELKSVADADPAHAAGRANVGIVRVGTPGRVEQHREARVEIEVGNYSPAARDVTVELALGKGTYRVSGLCPPGLTTTLWTNVIPTEAGWQTGEARLVGVEDALKADDRRAVVLEVRPSPTFVLVTRESTRPQATSSHFVERALAPAVVRQGQTVRGGARVVRVSPDKLDRDAIAPADLVVVDHPGRLSAPAANLLAGAMRRGRAVLYVAAETIDATNLKLIADAAGADMKMPVEFLPPGAGQVRRGLFLAEVRKVEAPFAV
ncbi:MAG: BatA and WFA domain-containing protein, partial [Phycisphaerae bacterium]